MAKPLQTSTNFDDSQLPITPVLGYPAPLLASLGTHTPVADSHAGIHSKLSHRHTPI